MTWHPPFFQRQKYFVFLGLGLMCRKLQEISGGSFPLKLSVRYSLSSRECSISAFLSALQVVRLLRLHPLSQLELWVLCIIPYLLMKVKINWATSSNPLSIPAHQGMGEEFREYQVKLKNPFWYSKKSVCGWVVVATLRAITCNLINKLSQFHRKFNSDRKASW